MGYPIRINICHWERSNAENPDTESVVSKMEITAAYGKGFTARSILKLLATDSKIQSGQRQISRYVSDISVFYIRVENSTYVFVLFPRLPTPRLARYAPHLPCFRFRGRSYGRGSENNQDRGPSGSDKKISRNIQVAADFFVLKSCLYSAPLKYSPQKRKQGKRGPYGIKKRS